MNDITNENVKKDVVKSSLNDKRVLEKSPSQVELEENFKEDYCLYHPIKIKFENIIKKASAIINIGLDGVALWSEGPNRRQFKGINISSEQQSKLCVSDLFINAKIISFQTTDDCLDLNIDLFVKTNKNHLRGRIMLPPAASVTLSSSYDQTSLIGMSSFGLDLSPI